MFRIRDLIKWERLTGRPFTAFDPSREDDFNTLLYVTSGQDTSYTFDEFRAVVRRNPRLMGEEARRVERARRLMEQYAAKAGGGQSSQDPGQDGRAATVTETAYALIAAGMDAGYLLEQLPVWEMPPLAEAFAVHAEADGERFKAACEVWRLIAYYAVVPHVKKNSVKDAKSLFRFPWDSEAERKGKERALREIEERADEFKAFMRGASGKDLEEKT